MSQKSPAYTNYSTPAVRCAAKEIAKRTWRPLARGGDGGEYTEKNYLIPQRGSHLKRCDVSPDVDGVAAGVRRVCRRAFGDRHWEQERLLATGIHNKVVLLHTVKQVLRGSTSKTYKQSMRLQVVDKGACSMVLASVILMHDFVVSKPRQPLDRVRSISLNKTVLIPQQRSARLEISLNFFAHNEETNHRVFEPPLLAGT